jgi:predicted TIM-barrel fold metal-dependent hydrolase
MPKSKLHNFSSSVVTLIIASFLVFSPNIHGKSEFTGVKRKQIYFKDKKVEAIDIHFHAADSWNQLGKVGQKFIKNNLPNFLPDFLKSFSLKIATGMIYDPYGSFGIYKQCRNSGMTHCGLFATYAPDSWGLIDNEYILSKLDHRKNKPLKKNQGKAFFGLASIDVMDWATNEEKNLKNLDKMLSKDLFKGIKLAFIHNEVALDIEAYDSIYDLARKHNVPVYHHVGSSPLRTLEDFETEEEKQNYLKSYDPTLLTRAVKKYHDVKFIFGHMGFDFNDEGFDFSDEVFNLAKSNSNIYLEISAFGREMFDPEGRFMDHVLVKLKNEGLIDRTIYGSDGPLYPGATEEYLEAVLNSMVRTSYSHEEASKVLYDNSKRIFDL